ncbi:MAG: (d)CMP kinase [Myxococcales bacterium]|nr:(d)CMP kinase [Myxococcales bacterium]USN50081.1 MAG: (d)CMP kinase [Myxococcales bacterium]
MAFIVAIDGPAGTGKSSVARLVAKKLNFIYVDTGAIYRALAVLAIQHGIDAYDEQGLANLTCHLKLAIDEKNACTQILLDGHKVERELRQEKISGLASVVSQHQLVRTQLLQLQRDVVTHIKGGAIYEGRDIGTVVFPKAGLKIFITANSKTRAMRRFEEIQKMHKEVSFDEILESIEKRDERDKNRMAAPMQKAHDAKVIDTSHMTIQEVCDKTIELVNEAQKNYQEG